MIDPVINEALNKQITEEFYSAYLYLSMAAYCEDIDLAGFANWMHTQYQEELLHAEKLYRYINDRDGRITLKEIKSPPGKWESPLAVFEAALAHEEEVTEHINRLTALALEKADHATHFILQWFVNEQVEEEKTARDIVQDLKRVADSADGIFIIDRELAQRTLESNPAP